MLFTADKHLIANEEKLAKEIILFAAGESRLGVRQGRGVRYWVIRTSEETGVR
jgi:hypothetical protein